MSYTALYRKWRPDSFDDVKGQDHIVTTLKNQIISGRVGHAYLFCGTRGTGKTTIAKIFAKAVNCEHPVDGSPCNECASCRAIQAGANVNVVEIDAASNNGVDNIREIRDEVQYSPAEGRYRVYIIDEVHMLSTGAFNALLKTLEEPPSYVIFILATTEAHKIPITVLSRCQRYDFRRISLDTIAARLRELTDGENIQIEEKALRYVAKKGDGSLRDAISLLDQCIAFYYGQKLDYAKVLDVLGAVDHEMLGQLLLLALAGRTAEVIYKLEEIVMQGRELSQLVTDFIWYLRNLLLLKSSDMDADALDVSEEDLKQLADIAASVSEETLMRYIRVFSELSNQIRYGTDKRVPVEIAFIKLTRPSMEQNLDSVLQRLEQLEKRVQEGAAFSHPAASVTVSAQDAAQSTEPEEKKEIVLPKAQLDDLNLVRSEWNRITGQLGGAARVALAGSQVEPVQDGVMCIVFQDAGTYLIGARPSVLEQVRDYVNETYQKSFEFKARQKGANEAAGTVYVSRDELEEAFHMEISMPEE